MDDERRKAWKLLFEKVAEMSNMPAVKHGTYLVLRTDGTQEIGTPPTLEAMHKAIGADTLATVILTWSSRTIPDLVMLVNDHGYETTSRDTATGIELIPQKALFPINPRATQLYWLVCKSGTTHQIVGDVAICHDQDVATRRGSAA